MKYIRTKDGIYESDKTVFGKHTKIIISNKKTNEVITEMICDYIEEKSIVEDMLFAEYCKTHKLNPLDYHRKTVVVNPFVIKQADTIEELCDVIVCNEKLFYPLTSNREGNKFNWEEIISCSHNVSCNADYKGKAEDLYFNIYGAIWTDKGLIYIAKMNDKGELELL